MNGAVLMAFIPIVHRPYPDELLTSWIYHLAEDNGLSVSIFIKSYLNIESIGNRFFYADGRHFFPLLYQNIHTKNFGNMKELYLQLTTFRFEAMILTPGQQTRRVNFIFRKKDLLNTPMPGDHNQVRICLKCFQEDISQYGRPYFHRAHQLPGIQTCYKHGIRLLEHQKHPRYEYRFDLDNYKEMESEISTKSLQAYTAYAQALFEANIETNALHIKEIVYAKLKELGYGVTDNYASFSKDFKNWKYADLSRTSNFSFFFRNKMITPTSLSIEEVIPVLMFLFPHVEEVIDKLQGSETLLEMHICPVCGREYCSTPQEEEDGWGCPYCGESIPERDRFKTIVETAGHGEYQVVDEFQQMSKRVRIYHKKCGQETSMKPDEFLFRGQRCHCEVGISFEEAQELIEANDGFKLIKFESSNKPIEIYHEECGQTFYCQYYQFLHHPRCKVCNPKFKDTDIFKKDMKDLVGDEYTLIGEYISASERVKIRHNTCGKIQEYMPRQFLTGQRCRECTPFLYFEDYQDLLKDYSNGKYTVAKTEGRLLAVQNTETGETIRLTPRRILQEISRPTPSPILPPDEGSVAVNYHAVKLSWNQEYDLLVQYKEEFGTADCTASTMYKGYPLGIWCRRQRTAFKKNRLSEDQISKLETIGFTWDRSQTAWDYKYDLCVQFLSETGETKISTATVYKGERIGAWIKAQKSRAGKLSEEKKQKLLAILPGIFS